MNKLIAAGFQQGFLEKAAGISEWWGGLTRPQKGFMIGAPIGGIGGYLLGPEKHKFLSTIGGGLGGGLSGALIGKLTDKKKPTKKKKDPMPEGQKTHVKQKNVPPKVGSKEFYINAFGKDKGIKIWKEKQKEYKSKATPSHIFAYEPKDITYFLGDKKKTTRHSLKHARYGHYNKIMDLHEEYVRLSRSPDYKNEDIRKLYLKAKEGLQEVLEKRDDKGMIKGYGSVTRQDIEDVYRRYMDMLHGIYRKNKELGH